jgi:hypothetical protein
MDKSRTDTEEPPIYHSYLLRLWREGLTGEPWRASLQSAATGERQGFASLDGLFEFIRGEAAPAPDVQPDLDFEEIHEKEVTNQSSER